MQCAACALWSTWPRPAADDFTRQYSRAYYAEGSASRFRLGIAERVMKYFRGRRARVLARILHDVKGKRILDVGCGRGYTLFALQQLGAEVFGTQPSAPAAEAAGNLIGRERLFAGELGDAAFPQQSFDAVTLWHVLEHVAAPVATLNEIARITKPGGLLYVEVPNAGGWAARTFGTAWLAYDIAYHLSHFTPPVLTALAHDAGFTLEREVHLSLEYSPVTLMQTWLNRLLGGDSALFRAVTFDGEEDAVPSRVPLAFHVAAAVLAFPAALVASFGLAACRRGDTYGAYFRRAA
jgi:SAM-dependent methyltransferase